MAASIPPAYSLLEAGAPEQRRTPARRTDSPSLGPKASASSSSSSSSSSSPSSSSSSSPSFTASPSLSGLSAHFSSAAQTSAAFPAPAILPDSELPATASFSSSSSSASSSSRSPTPRKDSSSHMPWALSVPGGTTLYLPGPEERESEVFAPLPPSASSSAFSSSSSAASPSNHSSASSFDPSQSAASTSSSSSHASSSSSPAFSINGLHASHVVHHNGGNVSFPSTPSSSSFSDASSSSSEKDALLYNASSPSVSSSSPSPSTHSTPKASGFSLAAILPFRSLTGSSSSSPLHSASSPSSMSREDSSPSLPSYKPPLSATLAHQKKKKLSQWFATAICGNDITSSTFYVTGLCVSAAGIYAPLCMLLVSATLYLFRSIYGEAVTALPLNGGAYNVLLNTTSKSTAAIAACLTILSYMATAVVSASSAIAYLQNLWPTLPVQPAVLLLLLAFALLCVWGIEESADVALIIFVFHMFTLATLVAVTVAWIVQNGPVELANNWLTASGSISTSSSSSSGSSFNPSAAAVFLTPPFTKALFFGFSSAMLGISGFESSSNYVEEQAEGVFVLTLRNMWIAVGVFNPLIAMLSLCVFSINVIAQPDNLPVLLAMLAQQVGGDPLRIWLCIDAFAVLAGSVLTAFVGVTGLCKRLALDRCLPQFLLHLNPWRKTPHLIIAGFFAICASIYLLVGTSDSGLSSLAAVYAVSFLSVMTLFAIGNMLLKYKRGFLPRSVRASWPTVFTALILVLVALAGVLLQNENILLIWCTYFFSIGALMSVMFFRLPFMRLVYACLLAISLRLGFGNDTLMLRSLAASMKGISRQAVAFFVKGGSLSVLNKAILYVRQNEDCGHIRIVHVYENELKIPKRLARNVSLLDEAYPKVKIDLILVKGQFGPSMIDYISSTLHIPKNLCFITSPKEDFLHKLESLGGVRLITH